MASFATAYLSLPTSPTHSCLHSVTLSHRITPLPHSPLPPGMALTATAYLSLPTSSTHSCLHSVTLSHRITPLPHSPLLPGMASTATAYLSQGADELSEQIGENWQELMSRISIVQVGVCRYHGCRVSVISDKSTYMTLMSRISIVQVHRCIITSDGSPIYPYHISRT